MSYICPAPDKNDKDESDFLTDFNDLGNSSDKEVLKKISGDVINYELIDIDGTLSADSDLVCASQKAIKAYVDALPKPLTFKGVIDIPGDFPTSAEVTEGWFYQIGTDVTDDDGSKANTGLSFTVGDEIA